MKHSYLVSRKYKNVCKVLNYIKHLRLKICAMTEVIKKYKSLILKKA